MPNEQELAKSLYERWRAGESKSQLEIETWDDATSHGAKFTSYVKRVLGVDTKRPAAMAIAKRNLEKQLLNHGLIPESDRTVTDREMLLLKARQAVLQALRIYNDPTAQFRIDSFLVSMHIAWSCLLQAVLEKSGGDPYYRDSNGNLRLHDGRPRAKSVSDLASDVFDLASSDGQSIKLNLDLLTGLRDQVVHRYIPALDAYMIHEIQANVLNFEKVLVEHFGADAALAGQLQVPLLLSTLRPGSSVESLKELQSQIPPDVISYLERFAGQVPDDIKENSHFRLKVFLTPVAANREKKR